VDLSAWVQELKRRRVFRALAGYGLVAFALLQVVEPVMHGLGLPEWVLKAVVIGLGLGLPATVLLAWAYDWNAAGLERTPSEAGGRGWRTAALLALGLLLAAPGLAYYLFFRAPGGAGAADGERAASRAPPGPSVAVLPFVNMSGDPENEYFSDGLSEEILNALAQLPGLRVPARTSAFAFKGKAQDVRKIAEALQVATVLEGSVRKAAGRVRITAQLVDAADGFHLWSQIFDRELKDIFAVQDEISAAIAAALKLQLAPGAVGGARKPGTTASPEAYESYLMGRHALSERTREAMGQALARFQRAIALDPSFAPAHAGAAVAEVMLGNGRNLYGDAPMAQALARARPHLERALALAPDHAEVLAAAGFVESAARDPVRALAYYDRAVALNPNAAEVHAWRRFALEELGRYGEVVPALTAAVRADPLSRIVLANYVPQLARYGRLAEAGPALARLRALDEGWALWVEGLLANDRGERAEAARDLLLAFQRGRGNVGWVLSMTLADVGLREEALALADRRSTSLHLALGDPAGALAQARAELAADPGSADAQGDLCKALYALGRFDEAAAQGARHRQAWTEAGLEAKDLLFLADAFRRAGRGAEASRCRARAGQRIEALQRAGMAAPLLDPLRATAAAFDGRDAEAAAILVVALPTYPFLRADLDAPVLARVLQRPDARAALRQLDARRAAQRAQVVAMLCGPDPVATTWRPAPGTCPGRTAPR
jgi:TolB-like protein